jgi:hypothetical protein
LIDIEELEVVPIYQLGQWKIIYIKAEDFQKTFYLTPPIVKARIFRNPEPYQYHYLKALGKNFNLRDFILMFPMERIPQADPRMVIIRWFDVIKNCWRTVIAPNIDTVLPSEFPPIPKAEDQNFGDKQS